MNNLPGSPWKRSGIIARAGVKTGGNYIRHHVGNALPIKRPVSYTHLTLPTMS